MTEDPRDLRIHDFTYHMRIPTRWGDNDMLGHLNNVIYYRFFEAIVVRFLMEEAGIDWLNNTVHPHMVESLCRFHRPLRFPGDVDGALRVQKIGNSSVTFDLALFSPEQDTPAATGHIVEVFVDTVTEKSVPVSEEHRLVFDNYS